MGLTLRCLKFLQLIRKEFVLRVHGKGLFFGCGSLVEHAVGVERLGERVEKVSFCAFRNCYSFAGVLESFLRVAQGCILGTSSASSLLFLGVRGAFWRYICRCGMACWEVGGSPPRILPRSKCAAG